MAKNKRVKKKVKKAKNKTSIIKKKTLKTFFFLLMLAVIVYIIYRVMSLIVTPTDTVIVENGIVSRSETTSRIHN